VGEAHRVGDGEVGAELGGQRRRGLDAQLSVLVDADGFIAAGLAGLPIGGEKHPRRVPVLPPLLGGHLRGVEVVAQRRRLGLAHMNPDANPHTARRHRHHRISDPTQPRILTHTQILTATTDNPTPPSGREPRPNYGASAPPVEPGSEA
jgi:hypothetical protein